MNQTKAERMRCMEVWGGNHSVERNFETIGLKIWVYSRPYGQAVGGGDVHYLSSCASGRITRMLLADVSGHGELVSQVAIGLRDLMRRNVNYVKQTRFVRAMNRQFAEFADHGGFATALVSTFFAPTKIYSLCNAGHPAPLIFRSNTATWSELRNEADRSEAVTDVPLGINDDAGYRQFKVKLGTGDMVLSFSDAVTESIGADGRQVGQAGILRLVSELDLREPDEVIPTIVDRITGLASGNLDQDDATLFLCQVTDTTPSLRDNLLAPFRMFKSATTHSDVE